MSDNGIGGLIEHLQFLLTEQGYDQLGELESYLADACASAYVKQNEVADGYYRNDDPSQSGHSDRAAAYEYARGQYARRIAEILRDWRELPDPEPMGSVASQLQNTLAALNTGASLGRAGSVGGEGIDALQQRLYDDTLHMRGQTMNRFRSGVTSQIPRVAGNSGLLSIVLGKAMTGQARLWTDTRTNVAKLVKAAGSAATASASSDGSGGDDTGTFLGIVGLVLAGAAVFGGPAAVTLTAVGTGSQIAGALWPDAPAAPPPAPDPYHLAGGTPDEVLDHLAEALQKLSDDVRTDEDALEDRLARAREAAAANPHDFDLAYARFLLQQTDDDVIAPEMKVNRRVLDRVATGVMQDLADQFRAAARGVEPGAAWSVWQRPEGIGGSHVGLATEYEWLAGSVLGFLESSEADVLACSEHLRRAANMIGKSDDDVDAALRAHSRQVERSPLVTGRVS